MKNSFIVKETSRLVWLVVSLTTFTCLTSFLLVEIVCKTSFAVGDKFAKNVFASTYLDGDGDVVSSSDEELVDEVSQRYLDFFDCFFAGVVEALMILFCFLWGVW